MTIYTIPQIVALAEQAGFAGEAAATMAAIATAESGGDSDAEDHDSNGTTDYGLAQINSGHDKTYGAGWAASSLEPSKAFVNAMVIYRAAGNSFTPWVTYHTGAYRIYLAAAEAALSPDFSSVAGWQRVLANLGYSPMPIDGVWGQLTAAATASATQNGTLLKGPAP
jgi:Lysozyme like domain